MCSRARETICPELRTRNSRARERDRGKGGLRGQKTISNWIKLNINDDGAKSGPTWTDDDALPNLVEESANPDFPQTTFCSCFTFTPSGIELAKVEGEEEQPSLPSLRALRNANIARIKHRRRKF